MANFASNRRQNGPLTFFTCGCQHCSILIQSDTLQVALVSVYCHGMAALSFIRAQIDDLNRSELGSGENLSKTRSMDQRAGKLTRNGVDGIEFPKLNFEKLRRKAIETRTL